MSSDLFDNRSSSKILNSISNKVIKSIQHKIMKILFKNILPYFHQNSNFKHYATCKAAVTALYDFHVKNGGKMVNFGGYMLPVQYNDLGIPSSHLHTRKNASMFDVSHMLQTEIIGKDCINYFESIITADLKTLPGGTGTLTVFTDEKGGILDDLIVTKIKEDHLYVVSNAACKKDDQKHMLYALGKFKSSNPKSDIDLRFFETSERSLLALQGPKAAECLQKLTNFDLTKLYFMQSTVASIAGVETCRITRCGYTGEDGFEISIPSIKAVDIAKQILQTESVKLAGLGARDSLRLEAGLCLYGTDITTKTTPAEAVLMWLVAKSRRERADFPGAKNILQIVKNGAKTKRIGLISPTGPPARHNNEIYAEPTGSPIGTVTSGCPSPTLKTNIAMGYVPVEYSAPGTNLHFKVRDKFYSAVVTKMPFVKTNYYVKPKAK